MRSGGPGRGRPLLLAIAALALSPAAAAAARFADVPGYVGGGVQFGMVASGNPTIDGARGPGLQVVFGRRFRDNHPLYFDMRLGNVFLDVAPAPALGLGPDRADYAVMAVGGLWDFRKPGSGGSGPWVSLHATYHNFNWRTFYYSIGGLGISPGAGVHVHLRKLGLFRVGLIGSFFSASSLKELDANGQSLHVSVDYLYPFGPRDER